MAVYAIGDVQGCYDPLRRLLDHLSFDPSCDCVWLVGDLVNRGPSSLAVLRFVRSLGGAAVAVLGNHDLHLLAVAHHQDRQRNKDTFDDVLRDPNRDEWIEWLCQRPLLHHDPALGVSMVHAGLAPQWDLHQALACASEVHAVLRGPNRGAFFHQMYGDSPRCWSEDLSGWERLRFIVNCFTRMRFCSVAGHIDLEHKGPPGTQPARYVPWFLVPDRRTAHERIVFGHWSALGYHDQAGAVGLDTGCAWGGRLTALRLEGAPASLSSVSCSDSEHS